MNQKLTLPLIAKAMASHSGRTKRQCEDFLRELFSLLADTLAAGEDVSVRGLGSFRIVDVEERKSVNVATGSEFIIAGHKKVSFSPDPALASAVNAAFDMFEPVELSDAVDDSSLVDDLSDSFPPLSSAGASADGDEDFDEEDEDFATEQLPDVGQPHSEGSLENEVKLLDEVPAIPVQEALPPADSTSEYVLEEEMDDAVAEVAASPAPTPAPEVKAAGGMRKCKFCWGVLTGFVAAVLLMGIGYLIYMISLPETTAPAQAALRQQEEARLQAEAVKLAQKEEARRRRHEADSLAKVAADSVAAAAEENRGEVDTRPSDIKAKPVEDIITTTRYLTTVAREHYGNDAFWPYIYEENKAILGHPDRIRPGTRITVPPLSKYGVDPKNAADIRAAKNKGIQIYARYRKK